MAALLRILAPGGYLTAIIVVLAAVLISANASAQPAPVSGPDQFYRGTVLAVLEEGEEELAGQEQLVQRVRVRLSGSAPDREIEAEFTDLPGDPARRLRPGDAVVVAQTEIAGAFSYFVIDRFRLPPIGAIFLLFFALAAVLSRVRGVTSIVGLAITAIILVKFVVPQIQAGASPVLVSLLGALVIALSSIYLAHGFSPRTTVAVAGTLMTLLISAGLAGAFVSLARLFGTGTEEALFLQVGVMETVNLRGLLLGGIILGALGVLDDITTSQAAAVDEIRRANPALSAAELYRRGISVGTEHITALVNTLFLAYAGASLPLFILFTVNLDQPLWVTLNGEFVAEEIVRTLVGSIALILAVPITTLLAARWLGRKSSAVPP